MESDAIAYEEACSQRKCTFIDSEMDTPPRALIVSTPIKSTSAEPADIFVAAPTLCSLHRLVLLLAIILLASPPLCSPHRLFLVLATIILGEQSPPKFLRRQIVASPRLCTPHRQFLLLATILLDANCSITNSLFASSSVPSVHSFAGNHSVSKQSPPRLFLLIFSNCSPTLCSPHRLFNWQPFYYKQSPPKFFVANCSITNSLFASSSVPFAGNANCSITNTLFASSSVPFAGNHSIMMQIVASPTLCSHHRLFLFAGNHSIINPAFVRLVFFLLQIVASTLFIIVLVPLLATILLSSPTLCSHHRLFLWLATILLDANCSITNSLFASSSVFFLLATILLSSPTLCSHHRLFLFAGNHSIISRARLNFVHTNVASPTLCSITNTFVASSSVPFAFGNHSISITNSLFASSSVPFCWQRAILLDANCSITNSLFASSSVPLLATILLLQSTNAVCSFANSFVDANCSITNSLFASSSVPFAGNHSISITNSLFASSSVPFAGNHSIIITNSLFASSSVPFTFWFWQPFYYHRLWLATDLLDANCSIKLFASSSVPFCITNSLFASLSFQLLFSLSVPFAGNHCIRMQIAASPTLCSHHRLFLLLANHFSHLNFVGNHSLCSHHRLSFLANPFYYQAEFPQILYLKFFLLVDANCSITNSLFASSSVPFGWQTFYYMQIVASPTLCSHHRLFPPLLASPFFIMGSSARLNFVHANCSITNSLFASSSVPLLATILLGMHHQLFVHIIVCSFCWQPFYYVSRARLNFCSTNCSITNSLFASSSLPLAGNHSVICKLYHQLFVRIIICSFCWQPFYYVSRARLQIFVDANCSITNLFVRIIVCSFAGNHSIICKLWHHQLFLFASSSVPFAWQPFYYVSRARLNFCAIVASPTLCSHHRLFLCYNHSIRMQIVASPTQSFVSFAGNHRLFPFAAIVASPTSHYFVPFGWQQDANCSITNFCSHYRLFCFLLCIILDATRFASRSFLLLATILLYANCSITNSLFASSSVSFCWQTILLDANQASPTLLFRIIVCSFCWQPFYYVSRRPKFFVDANCSITNSLFASSFVPFAGNHSIINIQANFCCSITNSLFASSSVPFAEPVMQIVASPTIVCSICLNFYRCKSSPTLCSHHRLFLLLATILLCMQIVASPTLLFASSFVPFAGNHSIRCQIVASPTLCSHHRLFLFVATILLASPTLCSHHRLFLLLATILLCKQSPPKFLYANCSITNSLFASSSVSLLATILLASPTLCSHHRLFLFAGNHSIIITNSLFASSSVPFCWQPFYYVSRARLNFFVHANCSITNSLFASSSVPFGWQPFYYHHQLFLFASSSVPFFIWQPFYYVSRARLNFVDANCSITNFCSHHRLFLLLATILLDANCNHPPTLCSHHRLFLLLATILLREKSRLNFFETNCGIINSFVHIIVCSFFAGNHYANYIRITIISFFAGIHRLFLLQANILLYADANCSIHQLFFRIIVCSFCWQPFISSHHRGRQSPTQIFVDANCSITNSLFASSSVPFLATILLYANCSITNSLFASSSVPFNGNHSISITNSLFASSSVPFGWQTFYYVSRARLNFCIIVCSFCWQPFLYVSMQIVASPTLCSHHRLFSFAGNHSIIITNFCSHHRLFLLLATILLCEKSPPKFLVDANCIITNSLFASSSVPFAGNHSIRCKSASPTLCSHHRLFLLLATILLYANCSITNTLFASSSVPFAGNHSIRCNCSITNSLFSSSVGNHSVPFFVAANCIFRSLFLLLATILLYEEPA
ncbi:unnamed protein product [Acanthosepion pharaonis]|uniref:Uncharacterized protein n=1 Tax=Acanthosepion pharaonis TaxID=158019 RepID=A0A812BXC9_ACAPH|nr:unnamed protein product [Sepia pharaonis]